MPAGEDIDIPHVERHLVVRVEVFPYAVCEAVYIVRYRDPFGFAREGRYRTAVAVVSVYEMAEAGTGGYENVYRQQAEPSGSALFKMLILYENEPPSNVISALIRGVKLGASGSKQRVFNASSKLLPSFMKSYTVSV
jgi:hypothetical protein